MTSTLVDSNVLIDLLSLDPLYSKWSVRQLEQLSEDATVVFNQIVFAEVAIYIPRFEEFELTILSFGMVKAELPWTAAGKAGVAHQQYRRNGGSRERVLADFLIGAHAEEIRPENFHARRLSLPHLFSHSRRHRAGYASMKGKA